MSEDKKHPTSKRRYNIIYILSVFTGVTALFLFIGSLYLGLDTLAYYHLVTACLYFFGLFLAKKGKIRYTRILFFILLNSGITVRASLLLLRPAGEMKIESVQNQFNLAKQYKHQTYIAENGVHGSSMLVKERVKNNVDENWKIVLSFLNKFK